MNPLRGAPGGAPGEIRSASHLYEFHEVKIQLGKEVRDLRFRKTWDIIEAMENGENSGKVVERGNIKTGKSEIHEDAESVFNLG